MKQHYLSECYLKEFTTINKQFYALDKNVEKYGELSKAKLKSPSQVCWEKNFYTLDFNLILKYKDWGLSEPYLIEKSFHWYEKRYNKVLGRLIKRATVSLDDAYLIAYAAVDFKLRNKYWRNSSIEDRKQDFLKTQLNDSSSFSDEILQKFKITREHAESIKISANTALIGNLEFSKEMHLYGLIERKTNPESAQNKIAENLLSCPWIIFTAPSNSEFITSDNPGFCFDGGENVHNTRFAPGFYFMLPLTPTHCLYISDKFKKNEELIKNFKSITFTRISNENIKIINIATSIYYSRYLFSKNPNGFNQSNYKAFSEIG